MAQGTDSNPGRSDRQATTGESGSRASDPAALEHAASNCREILKVVEHRLLEAEVCLREGNHERCKEILAFLQQAIPEAIATIAPREMDDAN